MPWNFEFVDKPCQDSVRGLSPPFSRIIDLRRGIVLRIAWDVDFGMKRGLFCRVRCADLFDSRPKRGRSAQSLRAFWLCLHARSHAPRGNAVFDAPRRLASAKCGRRASRTAFPRRAWERGFRMNQSGNPKILKLTADPTKQGLHDACHIPADPTWMTRLASSLADVRVPSAR